MPLLVSLEINVINAWLVPGRKESRYCYSVARKSNKEHSFECGAGDKFQIHKEIFKNCGRGGVGGQGQSPLIKF